MVYPDDINLMTKDAGIHLGLQNGGEEAYVYRPGCQYAACRAKEIKFSMPDDMAIDKMQ